MRKDEKNGLHKEKTSSIPRKIARKRTRNEERREKSGLHRAKNERDPSKIARKRTQNEERREKSGLRRAKNECVPSKNRPKSGSKRGKAGKTEILERKRWGGGGAKKWALLPILPCYEVTKWVQMNFSRIFFR